MTSYDLLRDSIRFKIDLLKYSNAEVNRNRGDELNKVLSFGSIVLTSLILLASIIVTMSTTLVSDSGNQYRDYYLSYVQYTVSGQNIDENLLNSLKNSINISSESWSNMSRALIFAPLTLLVGLICILLFLFNWYRSIEKHYSNLQTESSPFFSKLINCNSFLDELQLLNYSEAKLKILIKKSRNQNNQIDYSLLESNLSKAIVEAKV